MSVIINGAHPGIMPPKRFKWVPEAQIEELRADLQPFEKIVVVNGQAYLLPDDWDATEVDFEIPAPTTGSRK